MASRERRGACFDLCFYLHENTDGPALTFVLTFMRFLFCRSGYENVEGPALTFVLTFITELLCGAYENVEGPALTFVLTFMGGALPFAGATFSRCEMNDGTVKRRAERNHTFVRGSRWRDHLCDHANTWNLQLSARMCAASERGRTWP